MMHQLCFDFAVPRPGLAPRGWPKPPELPCVRCGKPGHHWTADCRACARKRRPNRAPVAALQRVPCGGPAPRTTGCGVMGWWRDGEHCAYCKRASARSLTDAAK